MAKTRPAPSKPAARPGAQAAVRHATSLWVT